MNDDQVIERLRAALDEVFSKEPPKSADGDPHTSGPGHARSFAIAAAATLVVAAIVALSVHRGHETPAADGTTAPATSVADTLLPSDGAPWYALHQPNLVAGEVTVVRCCLPHPAPGPQLAMAWGDVTGIDHGVLLLTVTDSDTGGAPVLEFAHIAMTQERATALQQQVVPGSGLAYVLPDPSMVMLGNGFVDDGFRVEQNYTSGAEHVELSVGDYRGQLTLLAGDESVAPTTVVGQRGYRAELLGVTYLVWETPVGTWATLAISPGLADRVDDIVSTLTGADLPNEALDSTATYQGVVAGIIDSGRGPMLAFNFEESLPPQGGSVPIAGFDWSMVDDEQTVAGTTWTENAYAVVGTWDGTTFTLDGPPVPATTATFGPTYNALTPGCTLETMAPMLDALGSLDYGGLRIIQTGDYAWDGHCGVQIEAMFDTPEVRAAAAAVGDDVTLTFAFHVVQP